MQKNQSVTGATTIEHSDKIVAISISTTAGLFPEEGFTHVPSDQKVEVVLEEAQLKLDLKDIADWVATVNSASGRITIDPMNTYFELGLSGKVEIEWGPEAGGGG